MTTVGSASEQTLRLRRRPAGTANGALQTRKLFNNQPRALLPIPAVFNLYNHFAKGVDTADQMRSYYSSLRRHRKTWRPLFNFLLDTIATNCYKLSSFATPGWPHKAGHKAFLQNLIRALLERSVRLTKRSKSHIPISHIVLKPIVEHGYKPERINTKHVACSACLEAGRKASKEVISRRKPLAELSKNTVRKLSNEGDWKRPQRAPRTRFGCRLCRIPLCKEGGCWQEHIDRLNTKK